MYSSSYVPLGDSMLTINVMLVDFFLTVTPCFLTSSGSVGSASLTRFCTSTFAMSTSVPTSKVTSILLLPSDEELFEVM